MRLQAVNLPPLVHGIAEAASVNYHIDRSRGIILFFGQGRPRAVDYLVGSLGETLIPRRRRIQGTAFTEKISDFPGIAEALAEEAEKVR